MRVIARNKVLSLALFQYPFLLLYYFLRHYATFCVPPSNYSNGAICRLLHIAVQASISRSKGPAALCNKRRGLFAASGKRSPLLVLTILRFT
uniref:Uncharacterized protein n=1 Tax=Siphoviridae sp. ctfhy6 TaxID=2825597 RepID=A0A8S5VAK8_9CAUD|nr:MAG TPA: hypothetical protein [Siphoviridae sp. ctfhy6]DAP94737.1 MAG TPA: hypothetical protein [Caudoviricetes sp.]